MKEVWSPTESRNDTEHVKFSHVATLPGARGSLSPPLGTLFENSGLRKEMRQQDITIAFLAQDKSQWTPAGTRQDETHSFL